MIRKLEPKDYNEIKEMLEAENALREYDYAIIANTYVLENDNEIIGFFAYVIEHGVPSLKNFCVKRNKRNLGNGHKLIKGYCELIKSLGYNKTIISSVRKDLNKAIEYYFRIKPYAIINGASFYIAEV